jgi:hypothetical protein
MASPQIIFRPRDEFTQEHLKTWAERNGRTISDEMRAAVEVYMDLLELGRLRDPEFARTLTEDAATVERRIKDDIGRILLAAVGRDARTVFEHDSGVEFPSGRIGHISIPFEKLIDWIVSGPSAVK